MLSVLESLARCTDLAYHIAGTANGKYSPSAQHQQAFMMEMFPDLRQSYAPPQTVQADPQQLPDTASLPQPSSNDILAGNLDQLTLHLQIARGCHAQKLAASQSDIEGKQASAGQTDQAAAAQAHIQPNGALPVATQAAKQQRKPQPPPYVATQRGHQHVGPDRFASDRWLNDAQPPLHRSISPPVPQTYAASPLLQQQYAPQAFLHGTNREGSSQSQSAQHALQQQALRRGQQMQQQRLGGMPRQHAAPPRSSSADNLQRHAIRPDPNVAKPFHGGAAALHPSQAVPAQQAEASGQVLARYLPVKPNCATARWTCQSTTIHPHPCDMHSILLVCSLHIVCTLTLGLSGLAWLHNLATWQITHSMLKAVGHTDSLSRF